MSCRKVWTTHLVAFNPLLHGIVGRIGRHLRCSRIEITTSSRTRGMPERHGTATWQVVCCGMLLHFLEKQRGRTTIAIL